MLSALRDLVKIDEAVTEAQITWDLSEAKTPQEVAMLAEIAATFAAVLSGNQLLDECQRDTIACRYYIGGVLDTLTQNHGPGTRRPEVCAPIGANSTQLRDIVVHYLQTRPESPVRAAIRDCFQSRHGYWPPR